MTGIFITFEGPDGSGKTTQLQLLARTLMEQGHDCLVTREPGGTIISDHIRSLLLSPQHSEMVDQTEVLLYAAARAQHVHERIIPALQQNKIVLCDRYIDASIAYQGYGLGISPETVLGISEFASAYLQPIRTYLLDVPVEESQFRIKQRAQQSSQAGLDRIESKDIDYHRKVRAGLLQLASEHPQRITLINGQDAKEIVAQAIWTDCQRLLKQLT